MKFTSIEEISVYLKDKIILVTGGGSIDQSFEGK